MDRRVCIEIGYWVANNSYLVGANQADIVSPLNFFFVILCKIIFDIFIYWEK